MAFVICLVFLVDVIRDLISRKDATHFTTFKPEDRMVKDRKFKKSGGSQDVSQFDVVTRCDVLSRTSSH
jgi:hypothetical protein